MENIPAVAARTASDNRSVNGSDSADSSNSSFATSNAGPSFAELVRRAPDSRHAEPSDAAGNTRPEKPNEAPASAPNSSSSPPTTSAPANESSIHKSAGDEDLQDPEQLVDPFNVDPLHSPTETTPSVTDATSIDSLNPDLAEEIVPSAQDGLSLVQESMPTNAPNLPADTPVARTASAVPTDSVQSLPGSALTELPPGNRVAENVALNPDGATQVEDPIGDWGTTGVIGDSADSDSLQVQQVEGGAKLADATAILAEGEEPALNSVSNDTSRAHIHPDAKPSQNAELSRAATAPAGIASSYSVHANADVARDSALGRQQQWRPLATAAEAATTGAPQIAEHALTAAVNGEGAIDSTDEAASKVGASESRNADTHSQLDPAMLTEESERLLSGQNLRRANSAAPVAGEMTAADRVRMVQRIAGAFQASLDRGGEVSLSLHPPELGHLKVEVGMREGKLSARMEAESISVQQLLLDSLPQLRERLAEHQIKIEQFQVDVMNQHNSHFEQTPHDRPDRQRNAEALLPPSFSNGSDPINDTKQLNLQNQTSRLNGAPWMLDRLNVLV